jgi:glycosyltransferase involved in cell wall biosynthesis
MKKAPVSMCIIVKNDPFLEQCILSFKDYVQEIIVIDTGSDDGKTQEIAKKYATYFEVYTKCNNPETGKIEDFSDARNYSFSKATQPWLMWCDSDDIIEFKSPDTLINIIEAAPKDDNNTGIFYAFPYLYSFDQNGEPTCKHYRERLFLNKSKFNWINPVHEVCCPNAGLANNFNIYEDVLYKHKRQYSNKPQEPGRNLRIIKKYIEKIGPEHPNYVRQLYYAGLEYKNTGLFGESIEHLSKYVSLSGWPDERVMACLSLWEIYMSLSDVETAIKWAFKAIEIKEDWSEGYLYLSRSFYQLATRSDVNEMDYWKKCSYFAKLGLSLPPTQTLLFVNPLDRECEIYKYLNIAQSKLGDIKGALESVKIGMLKQPNDPFFIGNKKIYEEFLIRQDIMTAVTKLKDIGTINQENVNLIQAVINNKEIPVTTNVISKPIINEEYKEIVSSSSEIVNLVKDKSKLDIVFFIGNGVEVWTPVTVKNTGIGGSELMAIELTKRLAALGHSVRVYNSCGPNGEGNYDGVHYFQSEKYHDLTCDVLIASRDANALKPDWNITSKLKLIWTHDLYVGNYTSELGLSADKVLALSNFHKQFLVDAHNLHPDHILTTRNGIDISRFENKNIKRDKFKCINSSSPDRSWPILLTVWPKIKERVPQATLTLAYGWKNWEFTAQYDKLQQDLIQRLKDQIIALKPLGVNFIGRVSQDKLAEEMLSAGAILHPTWFAETSCITAMEGQAAGLRIVSSTIGALNETVADRGILIPGAWSDPVYQQQFIEDAVKVLTKENDDDRLLLQQYAKNNFSLDSLAKEWDEMFFKLLDDKKSNPIPPYQPTARYK